jgi:hemolysin III
MPRFREPVNGFTHLAGAILSCMGLFWLVHLTRDDPVQMTAASVYGLSLILVYCFSAAYHLTSGPERVVFWLHRLDHAAIYILIAGSYTPLALNLLTGHWRWIILGLIWTLAVLGAVYKLLYLTKSGLYSLLYYIGISLVGLIVLPQIIETVPTGATPLLVGGGIILLIGCVIFGLEKPNLHRWLGYHELWHLCVLSGTGLHFLAVLQCIRV